nr:hypothetical protein [Tanacetum cinerariifolium]
MSSYEVIVNRYFGMPMDRLDPYAQLVMEAPPSPEYIPGPEAPPSPDYISGPKYPEYLPLANDVLPAEEQRLPAAVSPTAESPGYIADSKPEMDPEEEVGDDENSEGDFTDYLTSRGDDDADDDDDGDDLSEDDADDEDEEESSDSEEEEEEHLASTIPTPALHSSISASEDSDQTEPFEEGETAATPPPSVYRVVARISIRPHIHMPFHSESEVERLLAIPTPSLSQVSPTSYPLPPFLIPLPIFTPLLPPPPIILPRTRASMVLMRSAAPSTFILAQRSRTPPIGTPLLLPIPLPTSSFPLPLLLPSTSGSESIPEADMLLGIKCTRHSHCPERVPTGSIITVMYNLMYKDSLYYKRSPMRSASPSTFILAPRSRTSPIGTPPLLPIPLPTSSFPLPLSLPSTSGSESVPEADMPLQKRARFTTPIGGYEVGESSVAAAARHIRPALTITDGRRAEDRLIARLRRERRYFRTYTLQRQQIDDEDRLTRHIQHEHAQREKMAPKRARTTRANPDPTRTTTTTEPMTQEAINNLIAQRPRTVSPTRECTYKDYLNYGPLKFNGTEGVIVSQEVAYTIPWRTLKQMMTAKYCPRGEVKKLEVELWNLKESDEIERYVGRLPEMIRGNVMS